MKFSGKMCFEIILKITKNLGSILSLNDTIFEKPQGRMGGRGEGVANASRLADVAKLDTIQEQFARQTFNRFL